MLLVTSACGRIGYDEVDSDATCPAGTTSLSPGSSACIEVVERGTMPWTGAAADCAALGRRLCRDLEWAEACVNATNLVDMLDGGWEWVAEESAGVAQKRGSTECTAISSHAVVDPYEYRCCVDL